MDIDKLKATWKNTGSDDYCGLECLEKVLRNRRTASNVLAKLNRSFWIEYISGITAAVFLVLFIIFSPRGIGGSVIAPVILFVLVCLLSYYAYEIWHIKQGALFTKDLLTSLKEVVFYTERYLKWYRIFNLVLGFILLPPVIFYSAYVGITIFKSPSDVGGFTLDMFYNPIGIVLSLFCIGYLVVYVWFVGYFIKKMYGRHLDVIKEIVVKLEEDMDQQQDNV